TSIVSLLLLSLFFFFTDTAPTEIYTLSLHDALPISRSTWPCHVSSLGFASPTAAPGIASRRTRRCARTCSRRPTKRSTPSTRARSEEHTSELQSRGHLVCRLLLEKKKKFLIHRYNCQ